MGQSIYTLEMHDNENNTLLLRIFLRKRFVPKMNATHNLLHTVCSILRGGNTSSVIDVFS